MTAWCFICLMEMPFNISCGINPVSDISSVSNISIAGHCAMVLSLFLILSVLMIVLGKGQKYTECASFYISFLYAVISSGIYNNVYYGLFAASVTSVILMYCFNNLVKEQDVAGGLKDLKIGSMWHCFLH